MTYTGQPPWRQHGGEPAAANVASLTDAVLAIIALHLPGAGTLDIPGHPAALPREMERPGESLAASSGEAHGEPRGEEARGAHRAANLGARTVA